MRSDGRRLTKADLVMLWHMSTATNADGRPTSGENLDEAVTIGAETQPDTMLRMFREEWKT